MVKNTGETSGPGTIRPLNLPLPVDVEEDECHRPIAIKVRGRRLRVTSIDDTWEISDEWWRTEPVVRRYYQVTTEDGVSATIYRDLLSGAWYRQRG